MREADGGVGVSGRWEMGHVDNWIGRALLNFPSTCTHFFFLGFLLFYQGKMKKMKGGRKETPILTCVQCTLCSRSFVKNALEGGAGCMCLFFLFAL